MDTSNANQTGQVEDQDYYHIRRFVHWSPHGPLNVGNETDVGSTTNPYFRFFETHGKTYSLTYQDTGVTEQVPGVRFLERVRDGEINPSNLAQTAVDLASHLACYLGELTLEDVRRREFPYRPSRQRCVWLIPSRNGVRFWVRRLRLIEEGVGFQVVRVRVQGSLHRANESLLITDSMPKDVAITRARLYWGGVEEEAETEEILFEGRMRVEEVMPQSFYT